MGTSADSRTSCEVVSSCQRVEAPDGASLCIRTWRPTAASGVRHVAILAHGIGLHSEPYALLGHPLAEAGVAVYAPDLRGHGLSDGPRARLSGVDTMIDDLDAVVGLAAERHPDRPPVFIGESMGGLYAMAYAAAREGALSGLVLINPALGLRRRHMLSPGAIRFLIEAQLRPSSPSVDLTGELLEVSTRDPAFIALRHHDELSQKSVSPEYVLALRDLAQQWETRYTRRLGLPLLLLLSGDDRLLRPDLPRRMFRIAPSRDKTGVVFLGARHTLLWDPASRAAVDAVLDWLLEH